MNELQWNERRVRIFPWLAWPMKFALTAVAAHWITIISRKDCAFRHSVRRHELHDLRSVHEMTSIISTTTSRRTRVAKMACKGMAMITKSNCR